ncbi:MAG: hypothetical protein BMS9Abin13_491 [Patescibacteria group bacterium]|nr:MAG: hypothetical protein BMS9Abin13_491 [Patescibacteria group bacterium]
MILTAFKQVFGSIRYAALAVFVALAAFAMATWLPNLELIFSVIASSNVSLFDKLGLLASLTGSIQTNFTAFSASYTIAVAILFGVNAAMILYYVRQKNKSVGQNTGVASFGGFVSGAFGVGCAACGTLVLGPFLAFIGAGGLVAILPLRGQEFGVLAIGLLGTSIAMVAGKIQIASGNKKSCEM